MKKYSAGFILTEIMIALVILGLVLVTCIQAVSSLIKSNASSYNLTLAAATGQQLLVKIQQNEFQTGSYQGIDENNEKFRWIVDVANENDYQKKYTCSVLWKEAGHEKSFDFITMQFVKPEN